MTKIFTVENVVNSILVFGAFAYGDCKGRTDMKEFARPKIAYVQQIDDKYKKLIVQSKDGTKTEFIDCGTGIYLSKWRNDEINIDKLKYEKESCIKENESMIRQYDAQIDSLTNLIKEEGK
jgi:hypothetical protein